jgi:hypothetical protein
MDSSDEQVHGENYNAPQYVAFKDIDFSKSIAGFRSLLLFDSPDLSLQSINVCIVDQFITQLEYKLLKAKFDEERTAIDQAIFVTAQSHMWIFAVYELFRTWRDHAKNILKWSENRILEQMRDGMQEGSYNQSVIVRKQQLQQFIDTPTLVSVLARDIARTDIIFYLIEAIRIRLAKHELPKVNPNSRRPRSPTHGMINQWCGSLDYELEDGIDAILGAINRRDIADGIRGLALNENPQDEKTRADMKEWLKGLTDNS